MYEHRTHRLLPWPEFLRRAARHLLWSFLIVSCALGVGTVGYRVAGKLNWVDAFLNASMILGGMGPVDRMETTAGKIFAQLNLPGTPGQFAASEWGGLAGGHAIGEPAALFPRKDQPKK